MADFYLTLPSNSSMTQYPNNHTGHYFTQLPQNIDLTGHDYEIGLAEIQIPNSYWNVGKNTTMLSIKTSRTASTKTLFLRAGLYATPEELIFSLNELIKLAYTKEEKKTIMYSKFFYNRASKKAILKIYEKGGEIQLNPTLQHILCMSGEIMTGPAEFEGDRNVDVHVGSYSIYVYCDLVLHRQVGDVMVPLLRVVPSNDKTTDMIYQIFEKPHYQRLARTQFNTVEILLTTDTGKPLSFANGTVVVTLHVRSRRLF